MLPHMTPIKLYRHPISGHSHRVELMLSLLDLPFERIEVDLLRGEQKSAAFLAKNPFGLVPVIEDGSVRLADSNAILVYLALRYDPEGHWLPRDPVHAAEVQRFLSLAAGELVRGPAALRAGVLLKRPIDRPLAEQTTVRLFTVLEAELSARPFLVGDRPTLADVALYTYTAHVPEGDFSLASYPQIRAWIARIESLPRFVPLARPQPPNGH